MNEERKLDPTGEMPAPLTMTRDREKLIREGFCFDSDRDCVVVRELLAEIEALRDARGWFQLDGAGANVRRKIDSAIAKAEAATGAPVEATAAIAALRSHQWTGCQQGGNPADATSYEWVRYCKVCGIEDTCEDPLPPCPGSDDEAEVPAQRAEDHDWEARLAFVQRRIDQGIHTRAELYCKEAIEEIALLRSQLAAAKRERDAWQEKYREVCERS